MAPKASKKKGGNKTYLPKYSYWAKAKLAPYPDEEGCPFYLGKGQDEQTFFSGESIRESRSKDNEEMFHRPGMSLSLSCASFEKGIDVLKPFQEANLTEDQKKTLRKTGLLDVLEFLATPEGRKFEKAVRKLNVGLHKRIPEKEARVAIDDYVDVLRELPKKVKRGLSRWASMTANSYLFSMTLSKDAALLEDLPALADKMLGSRSQSVKAWVKSSSNVSKFKKALLAEFMDKVKKNGKEKKRRAADSSSAAGDSDDEGDTDDKKKRKRKNARKAKSSESDEDDSEDEELDRRRAKKKKAARRAADSDKDDSEDEVIEKGNLKKRKRLTDDTSESEGDDSEEEDAEKYKTKKKAKKASESDEDDSEDDDAKDDKQKAKTADKTNSGERAKDKKKKKASGAEKSESDESGSEEAEQDKKKAKDKRVKKEDKKAKKVKKKDENDKKKDKSKKKHRKCQKVSSDDETNKDSCKSVNDNDDKDDKDKKEQEKQRLEEELAKARQAAEQNEAELQAKVLEKVTAFSGWPQGNVQETAAKVHNLLQEVGDAAEGTFDRAEVQAILDCVPEDVKCLGTFVALPEDEQIPNTSAKRALRAVLKLTTEAEEFWEEKGEGTGSAE